MNQIGNALSDKALAEEEWSRSVEGLAEHLGSHRRRQIFFAALVGVALAVGVFVLWMIFRVGGAFVTGRVGQIGEGVAAFLAGLVCLVIAFDSRGRVRVAWILVGSGAFAWALGEAVWCWYGIAEGVAVPFPSLADAGFLMEVPLFLAGVLCFPTPSGNALSRIRAVLDGVIIGGSIAAVSWGTVLGAAYHAGGSSTFSRAIALAYPLSDVAVGTIAFSTLARTGRQLRATVSLVVGALIVLSISDSAFVYLTQTTSYTNRDVLDTGWVAGFLVLGLAALWPVTRRREAAEEHRLLSTWQVILPYIFLGSASVFTVTKYFLDRHLDEFLIADWLVVVSIVFARQVVTLLEDTRLTRSLERQTKLDPLTGVGNRLMFAERVNAILGHSNGTDRRLAVLLCDLDDFKDVNDTLGHSVGDVLLIAIAQRLVRSVRPGDLVTRLGGDEFAVVLETDTTSDQAVSVAIRVIDAMQEPLSDIKERRVPNMSIGIALQRTDHPSSEEVLRDADVALYAAKSAGGNCYRIFEESMGVEHFNKLKFQSEFAAALEQSQFFLEYEPILEIMSGKPIGVGALVRWDHPTLGKLPPSEFLHLAESSGAITPIGRWVLEEALRQLHTWRDQLPGAADLWMAVNVSSRQLASGEFVTSVIEVLDRTNMDPASLRLELTESAIIQRDETTIDLLLALRAIGIRLTIDDFGAGYSSLSYLKHLPVDALKIDRSFIVELASDSYDELIVESVVRLANARDIEVVAEGIETESQLAHIRAIGCGLGQGFLWAHPQPASEFGEWLKERYQAPTGVKSARTRSSTGGRTSDGS